MFELMALSDLITLKLWTKLDWKIAARPRQKPKARGEWVKYIFELSNLLSMGQVTNLTFGPTVLASRMMHPGFKTMDLHLNPGSEAWCLPLIQVNKEAQGPIFW